MSFCSKKNALASLINQPQKSVCFSCIPMERQTSLVRQRTSPPLCHSVTESCKVFLLLSNWAIFGLCSGILPQFFLCSFMRAVFGLWALNCLFALFLSLIHSFSLVSFLCQKVIIFLFIWSSVHSLHFAINVCWVFWFSDCWTLPCFNQASPF